ncbi:hypothetical protein BGZ95_005663, partial [Linnemannia exigua]
MTSGPTIRLALLLVRLRRVILQDFAVMMVSADNESSNRNKCKGFVHEIADKYPVLSSPDFLEYASYLRDSMAKRSGELSRTSAVSSVQSDEEVLRLLIEQGDSVPVVDEDEVEEMGVIDATESATLSRDENLGPEQPSTIRASGNQFPANALLQASNVDSDIIRQDIQGLKDKVASLEKD